MPYGLHMMEDYTVDVFANRDEPVPALSFGNQDSSPSRTSAREKLKAKFGVNQAGKDSSDNGDIKDQPGLSIQDRLLSRYGYLSPCAQLQRLKSLQASATSHSSRCRPGGRRRRRQASTKAFLSSPFQSSDHDQQFPSL